MQSYKLDLVSAPAVEPISLAEAKEYIRVDGSDEDSIISNLIAAARQNTELYTRCAFVSQTWRMFIDIFPASMSNTWWDGVRDGAACEFNSDGSIEVPLAPLQSVIHIKTYDDSDLFNILDGSNYKVSTYSGVTASNGEINLKKGKSWPSVTRSKNGVEIQFIAGYGDNASDVPVQIKQAILEEVAFMYENRGGCGNGSLNSSIARSILQQFRIKRL